MTIFAFMKKMNIKNKYVFSLVIISIMVAFLIHFPELVSLFDVTGQNALFPDTARGLPMAEKVPRLWRPW